MLRILKICHLTTNKVSSIELAFLFDITFFIEYNKGILKEKTMNSEIKELLSKAKTNLANGLMIGTAVGSIIGGVVFHDTESTILGVLSLILLELFNLNDKLDNKNSK